MQEPDPRIVERARSGDPAAFEELVRAHQGDAWRFARSLTRDEHLADDVTQDAFVRAFRFLPSFRGESRFTSWLFAIVRNCANDALRSRSRSQSHSEESEPRGSSAPDHELRVAIDQAIGALAPELREPFLLVEVFGMPYADASVVLRVKTGTVKSRVHRARQQLMAELSDHDEEARDEM